jgi:hypothetical protein
MSEDSLTVTDNRTGETYTVPIADGAIRATDLKGLVSYDPNLRLKLWPLARARAVIVATSSALYWLSASKLTTVCAPSSSASAILTICGYGSRRASRWPFSTRSPGYTIAAIWRAISPRCSMTPHGAARRSTTNAVLREFATRIRRDTRGIDLACRLGGEEFVVVMPDCDLAKAYQVGERLRQCIAAAPFEVGGKVGLLQVTASVGVAALEFDDDAPEQMLKRADEALYCAKRDGRNRVVADAA